MKSSVLTKQQFYQIAEKRYRDMSVYLDVEEEIALWAELIELIYKQGWEDGMSEGTEHAELLRKHTEKYK